MMRGLEGPPFTTRLEIESNDGGRTRVLDRSPLATPEVRRAVARRQVDQPELFIDRW
ncbi:hypothetical protein RZ533_24730 [Sphingobium yanoikuyae]|jgi:hypothetical protein|uniref:hypothetical protein n=1 Tax=Sphingobium sp. MP9-4 TaxID=1761936 RepID=UPI001F112E80|nr:MULTISPECIES: hypothetical protein [Sphingobium]MDV3482357.1 hypothetical protein [Sphingobium yanoikuyae]